MTESPGAYRLSVDGEPWEVNHHGDGQYDLSWTGENSHNYGFSMNLGGREAELTPQMLEDVIREFMDNINPETGFLDCFSL